MSAYSKLDTPKGKKLFFNCEDIEALCAADGGRLRTESLPQAYLYCEKIAKLHYENFPVGSILINKPMRKHFYAIYTYSRLADDIADEYPQNCGSNEQAISMLENLSHNADSLFSDCLGNPLLMALNDTMHKLAIPPDPLKKLTVAFIRDINFTQPETIDDLFDYCQYSANPVGEIVLRLFNEYDDDKAKLSDKICTALQLANFWQDISRDRLINRIYIPKMILNYNHISSKDLLESKKSIKLQASLNDLYDLTDKLFTEGAELINLVGSKRLKMELKLIIGGGMKILSKVKRLGDDVISERPRLNKIDMMAIFFKSIF